ncbi:MAG: FKBP-type peptidyl-prolyl cis-trans isomerase [Chloroflexi bacterium]|nr:FKBP-type peptidyl-prolyl cis-trans isomerase [Chloroflexota bacterium]
MKKKLLMMMLIAVALVAVACGPAANSGSSESSSDSGDVDDSVTAVESEHSGGSTVTASGLEYIEIEAGTGPFPQAGNLVSVHYTGTLEDGTKFDSSLDRGEPFQFALGQGAVIQGWDEGIALMKEGGKAQLIIPAHLAYGEQEVGGIPANSTLVFDVELVQVTQPPKPTEIDAGDFTETESGLKYAILEEGSGSLPQLGDTVSVHYRLWLEDGTLIDSSVERGVSFDFVTGTNSAIPGWEEGVMLVKEGGKAQLFVPPELGYGASGGGPIPPDSNLIFEIEVVGIQSGQ